MLPKELTIGFVNELLLCTPHPATHNLGSNTLCTIIFESFSLNDLFIIRYLYLKTVFCTFDVLVILCNAH